MAAQAEALDERTNVGNHVGKASAPPRRSQSKRSYLATLAASDDTSAVFGMHAPHETTCRHPFRNPTTPPYPPPRSTQLSLRRTVHASRRTAPQTLMARGTPSSAIVDTCLTHHTSGTEEATDPSNQQDDPNAGVWDEEGLEEKLATLRWKLDEATSEQNQHFPQSERGDDTSTEHADDSGASASGAPASGASAVSDNFLRKCLRQVLVVEPT